MSRCAINHYSIVVCTRPRAVERHWGLLLVARVADRPAAARVLRSEIHRCGISTLFISTPEFCWSWKKSNPQICTTICARLVHFITRVFIPCYKLTHTHVCLRPTLFCLCLLTLRHTEMCNFALSFSCTYTRHEHHLLVVMSRFYFQPIWISELLCLVAYDMRACTLPHFKSSLSLNLALLFVFFVCHSKPDSECEHISVSMQQRPTHNNLFYYYSAPIETCLMQSTVHTDTIMPYNNINTSVSNTKFGLLWNGLHGHSQW